jgi:chromosome segregation ATPase
MAADGAGVKPPVFRRSITPPPPEFLNLRLIGLAAARILLGDLADRQVQLDAVPVASSPPLEVPMSASRAAFCFALTIVLVGLFPTAAPAQLKDAQERGWSVLKDGYAVVASMRDNKSNRTRANFETALGKVASSMADMSPYIDRMGEKVADEDKAYAAGLKDNIRSAWKGVAETQDKCRRAYDAAKDDPAKLAEISDELEKLKAALEQYETACKAAYNNYKARWDEIKTAMDKVDADFKAAKDKLDGLDKQDDALVKEEKSLNAEADKVWEEQQKLNKAAFELFVLRDGIKEKLYRAMSDRKSDDYKRYEAEYKKSCSLTLPIIEAQAAAITKMRKLEEDLWRKEQDRAKLAKEIDAALDQMSKVEPLKLLQRYSLWDAEFPAKNYSFQSLK